MLKTKTKKILALTIMFSSLTTISINYSYADDKTDVKNSVSAIQNQTSSLPTISGKPPRGHIGKILYKIFDNTTGEIKNEFIQALASLGAGDINSLVAWNGSKLVTHLASGNLKLNNNLDVNGNKIFGFISGDNLNMNLNRITNLAAPTNSTDAATKAYVDNNGGQWQKNGNDIENKNSGKVNVKHDLDVNGNIKAKNIYLSNGNGTNHWLGKYGNGNFYIGAGKDADGSKNPIILYNLSCDGGCNTPNIDLLTDRVYIPGKVGIGTSSPSEKLNVVGGKIQVGRNSDSYKSKLEANALTFDRNGTSYIDHKGNGDLAFRFGDSYTHRVIIKNNGNVGIGTTSPSQKLDVNGSIQASSWVRVKGNAGLYFQDHGGGWNMTDNTWIRSYGNKDVYVNKMLRADNGFQVDGKQVINSDGSIHTAKYGNDSHYGYFQVRRSDGKRGAYFGRGNGGDTVNLNLDNASTLSINKNLSIGGNLNIGEGKISDNSIVSADIKNDTITEDDISDSFVARDSNKIQGKTTETTLTNSHSKIATSAAVKSYVDNLVNGLTWKPPVNSSPSSTYGTCNSSKESWATYNKSDNIIYVCNGSSWVQMSSTVGLPNLAGEVTGPITSNTIANNVIDSANIKDNTITEADISDSFKARDADKLDGLDSDDFQKRVSGSCSSGSSIRAIATDGSVTCEKDDLGADNLGNHIATQDLEMHNHNINNANEISINDPGEGIIFGGNTDGNIEIKVKDDSHDNMLGITGPSSLKVGIGTSSPSEKLDVNGNINHTGFLKSSGSNYSSTWMKFDEHQNGNSLILGAGGLTAIGAGESADQIRNNVGTSDETLYLASDGGVKITTHLQNGWNSKVDAVNILSNGNVGIGKTNPSAKLDINGNIKISGGDYIIQDNNLNWSIGGNGENLEFREPEDGNKLWAYLEDDKGLHLIGAPNLYASGSIQVDKNLSIGGNLNIGEGKISDDSIVSNDIKDDTITEDDISDSFVARDSDKLDGLDSDDFQKSISNDTCTYGIKSIANNGSITCASNNNTDTQNLSINGHTLSLERGGSVTLPDNDTVLTKETVQDYIGEMVSGNTENGISVTYNDSANKFDFTVSSLWSKSGNDISYDAGNVSTTKNLTVGGSITSGSFLYSSSDRRYKKNIKKINSALEKINKLEGVEFTWKKDGKKSIGLIAQNVEKVFPTSVNTDKNGYKSVAYSSLVAPIIEAIKELSNKVDIILKQQEKINTLENKVNSLEKRLEKLERKLK